jgi:hypothetical protein
MELAAYWRHLHTSPGPVTAFHPPNPSSQLAYLLSKRQRLTETDDLTSLAPTTVSQCGRRCQNGSSRFQLLLRTPLWLNVVHVTRYAMRLGRVGPWRESGLLDKRLGTPIYPIIRFRWEMLSGLP